MSGRKRKLSSEAVMEIRAWQADRRARLTLAKMAAKHGVSASTITAAGRCQHYKEVGRDNRSAR